MGTCSVIHRWCSATGRMSIVILLFIVLISSIAEAQVKPARQDRAVVDTASSPSQNSAGVTTKVAKVESVSLAVTPPFIFRDSFETFVPPDVGITGNEGVADGADWQVCRADSNTAWISAGLGGGTYNTIVACNSLGYDAPDLYGGNCNMVCGYCGTPGEEIYDGAGLDFPDAYRSTVNWRCYKGFVPPVVGQTGDAGVASGADWQVCRADYDTAWISAGLGGGTYNTIVACNSLGYEAPDLYGGNCNTVCGYCGTPGEETYDSAGLDFPDAYRSTVNWRCYRGFAPPVVGQTGDVGVASGADWQVCRADSNTAWISAGLGGGTYNTTEACTSLGYEAPDLYGGNCNTVCGYCGTPGEETYDGAGVDFPDAYRSTVNWRCYRGFVPPVVGQTGDAGVASGADWQVCRADSDTAWISAGLDGGTYNTTEACNSLGYAAPDLYGGNCNTVCGYCGTPGEETYDGAGVDFPDAFRSTVHWRCAGN